MLSPYLVENRHVAVKRCRHGLFMYNRNDQFIGRGLDLYGQWCEFEIQVVRRFINPGDTVIDAGANIGTHTIAFADLVGPTGRVHAFEPQRRSFHMLAGNVALNGIDNVVCHQKAVGDTDGEIALPPLPPADLHFNFGALPLARAGADGERVPLVRLDSLGLPACRLIKIDTEGMEPQVLDGARETIARCRPLLYVENNEPGASKPLSRCLDALGYVGYWSMFPYFDPNNFYANTVNIWPSMAPAVNLICAPKDMDIDLADHEPFLGGSDDWRACLQRVTARQPR
jgi:FkbM family methyltransferase